MYLESHGETGRALETFKQAFPWPVKKEVLTSIDYSDAQRVCPQGLEIGGLMQRAANLFT